MDLQQNVCYFMSMLIRRFPGSIELGTAMYATIQSWWAHGITKKSGSAEMLENAASFFLSYASLNIAGVTEVTIRNRYKELTEKLGIEIQL
ncbi:MAG: hypothetical protein J6V08_02425 [Candidatus Methanomethylophilaceae archaeon]|nr:hypothetical protein [Candidatus Methanomethylophilaceae archaeon]